METVAEADVPFQMTGTGKQPEDTIPEPPDDGKVRVSFEGTKYEMHPEVALLKVPGQTSQEFEEMRDDIKRTGLIRDAIVVAREPESGRMVVVDGWHRLAVVEELDLELGTHYRLEWVDYHDAFQIAVSKQRRRNLTDAQRAILGMRILAVEKLRAQDRRTAASRIARMKKSDVESVVVNVDALKQSGTIGSTYSEDIIRVQSKTQVSQIRGTFSDADGRQMVAVSGTLGAALICYPLTSVREFKDSGGDLTNYVSRAEEWGRGISNGDLTGIIVNYKPQGAKEPMALVLAGPPTIYQAPPEELAASAGKAATKAAEQSGVSTSTMERLEYILKHDPEAIERINRGENQPESAVPETINSAYERIKNRQKAATQPDVPADADDLTTEEFILKHPLYEQLGEDELFIQAVKGWLAIQTQLRELAGAVRKHKISERFRHKEIDQFTKAIRVACNIPHPYKWTHDPEKPGGFSITPAKQ